MTLLLAILALTLGISFFCSLLEGFILSISTAEIEALKQRHPSIGQRLELLKTQIEHTTAAILTLNTIANAAGSAFAGYLAGRLFGAQGVAILTVILTLILLLFCEILPKNMGVLFRRNLAVFLTRILDMVVFFMRPLANLCKRFVTAVLPPRTRISDEERAEEVLLLMNKAHRDGIFSVTEHEIVSNTLALDDIPLSRLMTPLGNILALPANESVSSVLRHIGNFSRLPVYDGAKFIGVALRDDLLHASALDRHDQTVRSLMKPLLIVKSELSAIDVLQQLVKNRQELCLLEGPSGQTLGLITMDDLLGALLGRKKTPLPSS